MSFGFIAPRALLEKKPPHGSPCTRCGVCCMASLCDLAEHVFGAQPGPCPALSFDAGGSICGLAALPGEVGLAAKHLINAGNGCDARFNGEPVNVPYHEKMEAFDRAHRPQHERAKMIWGMTEEKTP